MVWNKRNSQQQHCRSDNDLCSHQRWRTISTGDCHTSSRTDRRQSRHRNRQPGFYYYLLIGLFAVTPAFANEEDPKVQNTSNPVAAATGNVTNQNVNIQNSGAPSRQYFAATVTATEPPYKRHPFTWVTTLFRFNLTGMFATITTAYKSA